MITLFVNWREQFDKNKEDGIPQQVSQGDNGAQIEQDKRIKEELTIRLEQSISPAEGETAVRSKLSIQQPKM